MILPNALKNFTSQAISAYLKSIEILVLPMETGESGVKISTDTGNLKRIILSNVEDLNKCEFNYEINPDCIIDIYYRGTLEELNELEAKCPQAVIFDKSQFRIRCYSELDEDSNLYWHVVNGKIVPVTEVL